MNKLAWLMDGAVVVLVAAAAVPAAREAAHWGWASSIDTPLAYERFLDDWRSGRHGEEALTRQDEATWRALRQADDAARYEQYLGSARRETHLAEARTRADRLRYEEARRRNTVRSLQAYLDRYAQGEGAADARRQQALLRADPGPWRSALDKASLPAMQEFLAEYPGHQMQAAAEAAAKDLVGRDILELLRERKLALRISTRAPGWMGLTMQRTTPHPLAVRVPRGTLLVPRERTRPTLLVAAETNMVLKPAFWFEGAVPVLALQYLPAWRAGFVEYQLRPAGEQPRLAPLLAEIDAAKAPREVAAMAVWIATVNDNLPALHTQARQHGLRVPGARETAEALKIVERAGIDLASRTVWRERDLLARQLPAGPLKTWLEGAK